MMPGGDWSSEKETAITAAKQAGQLQLDLLGRVAVQRKGKNDLVTQADRDCQQRIKEVLLRRFPNDQFVGEEGESAFARGGRQWIVDPIDGTTNFVHGFPFFCVSIALAVDDVPVVGVIYEPTRRECFVATKGGGSSCNGSVLQVSSTTTVSDALLAVGIPVSHDPMLEAMNVSTHLSEHAQSLRRLGSAALCLAYVAAGRMEGYWASTLNAWDMAAGALLVQEAGGRIQSPPETHYNLHNPKLLATNGLIHAETFALILQAYNGSIR